MKKGSKSVVFTLVVGMLLAVAGWSFFLQHSANAAASEVAYADQRDSISAGVAWLIENNQNPDGGYGIDFSSGFPLSSAAATLDPIIAISSAGYNPAAPYPGQSTTPIDYLMENVDDLSNYVSFSGGSAGKTVLALVSANQNPRDFGGENWVLTLTNHYSATGQYNTNDAYNQSLAILGVAAVNEPVPDMAVTWLIDQQAKDGSWGDGFGTDKNPDAIAMAIMALTAAGVEADAPAIEKGLQFLNDSQLATGGWEYGTGFGENANSTALVIQALAAAGQNFYDDQGDWAKNGASPMTVLLGWQNENGAFQADFGGGLEDNAFATTQSIPAITGKPFPIAGRYEAAQRGLLCLETIQDPDSGGWEQFAGFGVNAAGTSRAIEAIGAFGDDPQDERWTPGDVNAVEALEAMTPDYIAPGRGGRVGIVLQGVTAAGAPYDVNNFASENLPLLVQDYLSPTGEYDSTAFGFVANNEAMLGLLKSGEDIDPSAVDYLLGAQTDGDWGSPDSNGTSLNVLGRLDISVPGAISKLKQTQQDDGGWGFGIPSSPSSTSEVVQGLVQSGSNPFSPSWSKVVDGVVINAADLIMSQQENNGCWPNLFGPGDDPFGTTDSVMLLVQDVDWDPLYVVYMPLIFR